MSDGWLQADDYQLALIDNTIVARNAKGRQLKSVPAKAKKTPAWQQLDDLLVWLTGHEREIAARVEQWLLNSEPVPVAVLGAVWDDPGWRRWLLDLVVADSADPDTVGLLRDVSDEGLGLITLDGDSVRIPGGEILIPHPVLLDDLADLREFAAELGVRQQFDQLYRPVHHRGALTNPEATWLNDWSGATYRTLRQAHTRALAGGFTPRGTDVVARVVDAGRVFDIRFNLADSTDPYREAYTGPLRWLVDDAPVPVGEVGPVAWSEGVRIAEWMLAGGQNREDEE